MTFEEIQRANSTLSTMDIKGKAYVLVNERIKAFRMLYPDGIIETELLNDTDGRCVFKAIIRKPDGDILGTGHAYEVEAASYINKTSYIENCETSAVGRALAMCGIGIDTSVASYEEVDMAIKKQDAMQEKSQAKPATKTKASGSGQKTMEVSTRIPTEEEIAEQPISEAKRKMIMDKLDTLHWSFESVFPKCKSWNDIKEGRFKEIVKFLDDQIAKRNLK